MLVDAITPNVRQLLCISVEVCRAVRRDEESAGEGLRMSEPDQASVLILARKMCEEDGLAWDTMALIHEKYRAHLRGMISEEGQLFYLNKARDRLLSASSGPS